MPPPLGVDRLDWNGKKEKKRLTCIGRISTTLKCTKSTKYFSSCCKAAKHWKVSPLRRTKKLYSHSLCSYKYFHCVNLDFADAKWNWQSVKMMDSTVYSNIRHRSEWPYTTWVGIFWTNWYNRTLGYYYRMDLDCVVSIVVCVTSVGALYG